MTLTIDLVSGKTVSGVYLLQYLKKETKIWLMDVSWDGGVSHTIFWSL